MASNELARRLRLALAARGLQQRELADKLGVSPSAVSHFLKGTKLPTGRLFTKLALALEVDLHWLMLGKGRPPSTNPGDEMRHAAWRMRPGYADGGKDFGNPAWLVFQPELRYVFRESCQNSLDARLGSAPAKVIIRLHQLRDRLQRFQEAAGWDELQPHIAAAANEKGRLGVTLRRGLRAMSENLIVATFNDFSTVGLVGSEFGSDEPNEGRREHFAALVRHTFDSQKASVGAGGSYGLGKNAAIASSLLRTVFYNSTLSAPESGKKVNRFIGRTDLGARSIPELGSFAGPGWYGAPQGDKVVSLWDDRTRIEALFLYRDREDPDVSGTSVMIPGFYDPSGEEQSIDQLAQQIIQAAAMDFWPALIDEKLQVIVETYDDDDLRTTAIVDPHQSRPGLARMYTKYKAGEASDVLTESGGVVRRDLQLQIPRRKGDNGVAFPAVDHRAVLLIERSESDDRSEEINCVAGFRSPGMIVEERKLSNLGIAVPKFRALLLVGQAVDDTPEALAAEAFFSAAEPPAHNRWTHTAVSLTEIYRSGRKTLVDLTAAIRSSIKDVLQAARSGGTAGPESILKHFLIPTDLPTDGDDLLPPPPPPTPPRAVRVLPLHWEDDDSASRVKVDLRVPPRLKCVITPALMCRFEDGGAVRVPIEAITGSANCEVQPDGTVLVDGSLGNATFLVAPDWAKADLDRRYTVLTFDIAKQTPVS